jgi:hypothetical protein
MEKKACTADKEKIQKKYLRQPSIDFHFCNISSSCDIVYKGRWLTQAGYWFILRFCEHFTCLSSTIQNAIKLENISNLITSPSSYQCIRKKTRLVYFVNHGRHISMEWMWLCAYWGSPNVNFKTNDKKILSYRIFIYNWRRIFMLRTLKICYMPVFCLITLGRHGNFTAGVTFAICDFFLTDDWKRLLAIFLSPRFPCVNL